MRGGAPREIRSSFCFKTDFLKGEYDVPHTVVSGVTRRSEWENHGGKAARGATGGGGDEGGDKWGRGWRATRSDAQRGEASGDDLKRAPVAPGPRPRVHGRVRRRRGGGEEGGEESGEGETLT